LALDEGLGLGIEGEIELDLGSASIAMEEVASVSAGATGHQSGVV